MLEKEVHLVLSGSGLKLYAFLHAILELHLAGYRFTRVTGTSGGAIVGAAMAMFYDPEAEREEREQALRAMIDKALAIDIPRHLDPRWLVWRMLFRASGIIKGQKILKALRRELPESFDDLKMHCEIVTFQVNLNDPRTRVIDHGDLPLAVRASMSIPYVFDPVWYDKALLVDGGWQMNLAIPNGGKDVVALTFGTGSGAGRLDVNNNLELASRLIDGAIDEGMRRAIDSAPDAEVIVLNTSIEPMDFFLSDEDKSRGMDEGAESVRQWLRNKAG